MLQIVRAIPLLLLIVGMYLFLLTSTLVRTIIFFHKEYLQWDYKGVILEVLATLLPAFSQKQCEKREKLHEQ